jgi:DNA-binding FrmR family transcriptional regulator
LNYGIVTFFQHPQNGVAMSHTVRDKRKLKARASKIEGQVGALKKMLDEPHECAQVLQQIAAIRGAVNGLMREVIKGHLTDHLVHEHDEAKREADLDVVLSVLDSYIR